VRVRARAPVAGGKPKIDLCATVQVLFCNPMQGVLKNLTSR